MDGTKHFLTSFYFIVWEFNGSFLRCSFVSERGQKDLRTLIGASEKDLLLFLDRHRALLSKIVGIGVDSSRLGSFASTRIILVTLTMFAWSRDIPIVALPRGWGYRAPVAEDKFVMLFKGSRIFSKQARPLYAKRSDITVSSRERKFTIQ